MSVSMLPVSMPPVSVLPPPCRGACFGVLLGALVLVAVGLEQGAQALVSCAVLVPALAALFALRAAVLQVVGRRAGAAARGAPTPCDRRIVIQELGLAVAAAVAAVWLSLAL